MGDMLHGMGRWEKTLVVAGLAIAAAGWVVLLALFAMMLAKS